MEDTSLILERIFHRQGALTAKDLCASLHVSQPTVSRMIARMGPQLVVKIGRTRAAKYAMLRRVEGLGDTWPLYVISENGQAERAGTLHALVAGQWLFQQEKSWKTLMSPVSSFGIYPDLPWFLDDLRPQGFLGRVFARKYGRDLGLPDDPRSWRGDDILTALLRYGDDLPGAFVLGADRLAEFQTRMLSNVNATPSASRNLLYPGLADAVLGGALPGSSAAGEQPKFTICLKDPDGSVRHAIVKFSGRAGRPEDQRWADLLAAEHHAACVLSEHGFAAAQTTLLEAGGRRFLESSRFDRVGAIGRRGLVSLYALDAAFFGRLETPWTAAAERLLSTGWISPTDAERLETLWWFGTLIGNTDMHYGNVSLFLGRTRPLALTPCYDMLPMAYRPDQEGEMPDRPLSPPPPPPEKLEIWTKASQLALLYWQRVAKADDISGGFQKIALQNLTLTEQYRRQFLK